MLNSQVFHSAAHTLLRFVYLHVKARLQDPVVHAAGTPRGECVQAADGRVLAGSVKSCVCVCVCMTEVSQGPAALRLCGWIELWVSGFNLCPKCHMHTEDGKRRRWNGRPWDQHLTEISAWFLWRKKKKSFWVWITHNNNNKEITMPPTHAIGWVQNHTLRKKDTELSLEWCIFKQCIVVPLLLPKVAYY